MIGNINNHTTDIFMVLKLPVRQLLYNVVFLINGGYPLLGIIAFFSMLRVFLHPPPQPAAGRLVFFSSSPLRL
jgi:hypothetical protein